MNLKGVLLLVGLVVGGFIGYLIPEQVLRFDVFGVSGQVVEAGTQSQQLFRAAIGAVVGGLVGLGLGFFMDQRR